MHKPIFFILTGINSWSLYNFFSNLIIWSLQSFLLFVVSVGGNLFFCFLSRYTSEEGSTSTVLYTCRLPYSLTEQVREKGEKDKSPIQYSIGEKFCFLSSSSRIFFYLFFEEKKISPFSFFSSLNFFFVSLFFFLFSIVFVKSRWAWLNWTGSSEYEGG